MIDIYNSDFEYALISNMLYSGNNDSFDYEIFNKVRPGDFYLHATAKIYEIIIELHSSGMEIHDMLIKNKIGDNTSLESALLHSMSITPLNPAICIEEILKRKKLRDILMVGDSIKALVSQGSDAEEIFLSATKKLEGIQDSIFKSENKLLSAKDLLEEKIDSTSMLETNFLDFDEVLNGGYDYGSFNLFVGEPESGKTHISYSIAESVSNSNKVGILSLEFGKVDYDRRLKGFIQNKTLKLNTSNIFLEFDAYTIEDVVKVLYRFARAGVKLVVIDSLHKIINNTIENPTYSIEDVAIKLDYVLKRTGLVGLIIALGSKQDYAEGRMGVKNSSSLPHLAKSFVRIVDTKTARVIEWHKNKQGKKTHRVSVVFSEDGTIDLAAKTAMDKKPKRIINIKEIGKTQ